MLNLELEWRLVHLLLGLLFLLRDQGLQEASNVAGLGQVEVDIIHNPIAYLLASIHIEVELWCSTVRLKQKIFPFFQLHLFLSKSSNALSTGLDRSQDFRGNVHAL